MRIRKNGGKPRRTLKDDLRDTSSVALKGGIGAVTALASIFVPQISIIAPILQEAIGARIPDYRRKRVENLLLALTANVNNLGAKLVEERFESPEFLGLLEEGCLQAQTAVSEERIRYISTLLTKCLSDEELDHITAQRMLAILAQLNDVEVIFLITEKQRHATGKDEFWEKTSGYFPPVIDCDSSLDAFKRRTVLQSYEKHLLQLGLVDEYSRSLMSLNCAYPELNIIKQGLEITILGNALLDYVHSEKSENNELNVAQ